jgi:hypothetical protein
MELKPMYLPIELVLNVINQILPKYTNVMLHPSHPITQTLLSFTLVCHATYRLAKRYLLQYCVHISSRSSLHSLLETMSRDPTYRNIPSMHVTPFGDTTVDLPTAESIGALLNYVGPCLKRLIIHLPFADSTYRREWEMSPAREEIYSRLSKLSNMEELVIVGPPRAGGAFMRYLRGLPKLKRLALSRAWFYEFPQQLWKLLADIPALETLVLTSSMGMEASNIKRRWFNNTDRPLKLLLVNAEKEWRHYESFHTEDWNTIDPQKKMTIMTYNVPRLYPGEDADELCQEYVKAGAENGTLWDWEADVIPHPPKIEDPAE